MRRHDCVLLFTLGFLIAGAPRSAPADEQTASLPSVRPHAPRAPKHKHHAGKTRERGAAQTDAPQVTRQELLSPPQQQKEQAALSLVPIPAAVARSESPPRKQRKAYLDSQGIVVGDFRIQPMLAFSTDTRYDDANTRERALRDEMDELAARQRGERHADPLSFLFRKGDLLSQTRLRLNPPGFPTTTPSVAPGK
jgi:hypothetical protein